jgi:hypothetical protein
MVVRVIPTNERKIIAIVQAFRLLGEALGKNYCAAKTKLA